MHNSIFKLNLFLLLLIKMNIFYFICKKLQQRIIGLRRYSVCVRFFFKQDHHIINFYIFRLLLKDNTFTGQDMQNVLLNAHTQKGVQAVLQRSLNHQDLWFSQPKLLMGQLVNVTSKICQGSLDPCLMTSQFCWNLCLQHQYQGLLRYVFG